MVISKNLTMPVTHPFNDNGSGTAPIHNDNADEQRLAQMGKTHESGCFNSYPYMSVE